MPWLRVGDTAASHPVVLRAWSLPEADARLKNELFGFVAMCAAMSAAFKTDYVVEMGTVVAVAGFERGRVLADAAVACGYFSVVEGEQGQTLYRIIDDPELFHMRLKDEIEWENRQRNDTRNKSLTVPVRARDGDACRWCGRVVYWGDQKSLRGATYDHVDAGRAAESVNDLVVSCRGCNSARKNNSAWGKALLPEPRKPYYAQKTVDFLAENGVRVALSPESEKPLVDRSVALADAGVAGSDGGLMLSSCEGGGDCAPAPEASGVRDCPAPVAVVDDDSSACSSLPADDSVAQSDASADAVSAGGVSDGPSAAELWEADLASLETEGVGEGDASHSASDVSSHGGVAGDWHPASWGASDGGLMLNSRGGGGDCAPAPEVSGVRDCPASVAVVDDDSSACSSLPATDAFHNVRLPITPNLTPTDSDPPGRVGSVSAPQGEVTASPPVGAARPCPHSETPNHSESDSDGFGSAGSGRVGKSFIDRDTVASISVPVRRKSRRRHRSRRRRGG